MFKDWSVVQALVLTVYASGSSLAFQSLHHYAHPKVSHETSAFVTEATVFHSERLRKRRTGKRQDDVGWTPDEINTE